MRPEDDLFPRWWVALAVTLLGAWLVYAVAMTVHAWPLIAGEVPPHIAAAAWFFYAAGVCGPLVGGMFVVIWAHAGLVMGPLYRRALFDAAPPPPLPEHVP